MKLVVIGNPINHSLSPYIHNYWLKDLGKTGIYTKKKVKEENLAEIVNDVKNKKFIGVNITIPFKEKILKYVDEIDEVVKASLAANTLFLKNNRVVATNTDGIGFVNSVQKDCRFQLKGKSVFLVGAGGAARGILSSLIKKEVKEITLQNRDLSKVEKILKEFKKKSKTKMNKQSWEERKIPESVDLLINATSLGLKKDEGLEINLSQMKKTSLVYDIVYAKGQTKLIQEAVKFGLRYQGGHAMLVRQASESFKIWFGKYPNEEKVIQLIQLLEKQK